MGVTAVRRAEAEIVVTGTAARSFVRAELIGVRYCAFEEASDAEIDDALRDADMLLFVVGSNAVPTSLRAHAIGARARARGMLVAALVVAIGAVLGRSESLIAMRDTADMVMIVSSQEEVRAVVAALR